MYHVNDYIDGTDTYREEWNDAVEFVMDRLVEEFPTGRDSKWDGFDICFKPREGYVRKGGVLLFDYDFI